MFVIVLTLWFSQVVWSLTADPSEPEDFLDDFEFMGYAHCQSGGMNQFPYGFSRGTRKGSDDQSMGPQEIWTTVIYSVAQGIKECAEDARTYEAQSGGNVISGMQYDGAGGYCQFFLLSDPGNTYGVACGHNNAHRCCSDGDPLPCPQTSQYGWSHYDGVNWATNGRTAFGPIDSTNFNGQTYYGYVHPGTMCYKYVAGRVAPNGSNNLPNALQCPGMLTPNPTSNTSKPTFSPTRSPTPSPVAGAGQSGSSTGNKLCFAEALDNRNWATLDACNRSNQLALLESENEALKEKCATSAMIIENRNAALGTVGIFATKVIGFHQARKEAELKFGLGKNTHFQYEMSLGSLTGGRMGAATTAGNTPSPTQASQLLTEDIRNDDDLDVALAMAERIGKVLLVTVV